MVLQKLWVSQNFSRISRVLQSRFSAVLCVSQSRFLYEGVSESRFFARLIRVSRTSSWRQRGRVVRASDLKSEGRGFKSRSDR